MRQSILAAALALLFLTGRATAQVIYLTPFESPVFVNGNLAGQDGWTSTDLPPTPGRAVIQNTLAQSGSRAVGIDAATGFQAGWWWKTLNFPVQTVTAPIIQIKWDMYLDGSATPLSAGWGIDVYDTTTPVQNRVTAMLVNDQGTIQVWSNLNFVVTNTSVTRNAWHGFRFDLNYAAPMRANLYMDGQLVAQNMPFAPGINTTIGDVDLYLLDGNGADKGYYDNFCVVALTDIDGDGVADTDDACPNTAAGEPVDGAGCSLIDTDSDGVTNDTDACPGTPTCAPVDTVGCPSDSDGDGVLNGCDNCIAVFNPDQQNTDGDALGDVCDPCPNRKPGDVSGDGKVDGRDITSFKNVLLGGPATADDLCAADINTDTVIDFDDMTLLVNLLLGP